MISSSTKKIPNGSSSLTPFLFCTLHHNHFAFSFYTIDDIAIITKISQNVNFSLVLVIKRETRASLFARQILTTNVNEYYPSQIDVATAIHLHWWGMRALSKVHGPFHQPGQLVAHQVATITKAITFETAAQLTQSNLHPDLIALPRLQRKPERR